MPYEIYIFDIFDNQNMNMQAKLPQELPNDLRLKKSGNFKEISEMFENGGKRVSIFFRKRNRVLMFFSSKGTESKMRSVLYSSRPIISQIFYTLAITMCGEYHS